MFVLALLATIVTAAVDPPYMLSVTASSDYSKQNRMIAFDVHNVSNQLQQTDFPFYESAIASAYDKVGGRYYVLTEGSLACYNASTFDLIANAPYPVLIGGYWPDTMHYDSFTGLVWLLFIPKEDSMQFCSTPGAFNSSSKLQLNCSAPLQNEYMYTTDSSVFDHESRVIWTILQYAPGGLEKGIGLVSFNVDTQTANEQVKVAGLCQNMQLAVVDNAPMIVCVRFSSNELVHVNEVTGSFTRIHKFEITKTPEPYATAIVPHADGSTSSYFALLFGSLKYEWIEIDVKTGNKAKGSTTTEIATKDLPGPLAHLQYVN
jgi:hypothetical protein